MHPTLLDLDTGLTHILPENEANVFQWCEDNYSCDCNRALFVGRSMGLSEPEVNAFAFETDGTCVSRRFVMVDVHGDLEGHRPDDLILRANQGYPEAAQDLARNWRRIQQEQVDLRATLDGDRSEPGSTLPRRPSSRL